VSIFRVADHRELAATTGTGPAHPAIAVRILK